MRRLRCLTMKRRHPAGCDRCGGDCCGCDRDSLYEDGADAAVFLVNIGCCAVGGNEPADQDMDSGYGGGTRRTDRRPVRVSQDHGAGDREKRSIRIFCTGTRGKERELVTGCSRCKSSGTRSFYVIWKRRPSIGEASAFSRTG